LISDEPTAPTPYQAGPTALQRKIWCAAKPASSLAGQGLRYIDTIDAGDAFARIAGAFSPPAQ
jgi:hypothetical protein